MPFFDDDGTEVNLDLFPKPQLCLSCKKRDDVKEELLCNLTRLTSVTKKNLNVMLMKG